jgi:hypothetical protein
MKKRKIVQYKFCLLIFMFCIWFKSHSQVVNIENRRIYDDSTGFSGAFDAVFSYIQNKDYIYNVNLRNRLQYKNKKHYFLLLNDIFYSGGEKVYANFGMGHFRYAYRIKQSGWKIESYSQIQYNQLLNQKIRTLVGAGIRGKILGKEKVKLFFGSSIFYEYEEIQPNNEFNRDFRWSNYLSWFMSFKHFSFSGTSYFQPKLEDFNDYRFAGQYTFETQITKKMRFKTDVNIFHDTRPPENVRSTISNLLLGFSYSFGK